MSTIGNIFQQNNPYEKFVQQLVQLESRNKLIMEAEQKTHRERKTALGQVSSAISKFNSTLNEMANPDNNSFKPLSTSTTNDKVVSINSATGIERATTYNITVNRLASNDIALSQTTQGEATTFAMEGDGSVTLTIGEQTETISVETVKTDDEGNPVQKTNSEILASFAGQINELFGDKAQASVFQVNSENVQLSIQSLETGFENRIQFSDADGVLAAITNDMSKLVPEAELNAQFTIDGVAFEREQNTISDAIEGLSFTLRGATGDTEQMTVQQDMETARSNMDDFIKSFNEMNKTIRDRTFVDPENERRGALQNMRSIRNLTLNLRQSALLPMDSAEDGQLSRLSDFGIGFEKDGTMKVEDSALLDQMLQERPDEIMALFTGEDSGIAQMKAQTESYTQAQTGVIAAMDNGIDQQIKRLDARIAAQDRYLEQYEQRQREIFNRLQQIIEQGQQQFDQILNFQMMLGR
ncbi:MAG: flagellar filament capping protein FliD [Balneolales bacterium]